MLCSVVKNAKTCILGRWSNLSTNERLDIKRQILQVKFLYLKEKVSLKVQILNRKGNWFARGVNEAIYIKLV